MEFHTKTELTPEEKLEDSNSGNYIFNNETKAELLNLIKEVFELSNYTKTVDSEEKSVENVVTDKEIIIVSLNTFLKLITEPLELCKSIGLDFKENLNHVPISTLIKNIFDINVFEFNLMLDIKGTPTLELEDFEDVIRYDNERMETRKFYLESKKEKFENKIEEIEKELATLETN